MDKIARPGRRDSAPLHAYLLVFALIAFSGAMAGCHAPPAVQPAVATKPSERFANTADLIRKDPVAYLRQVQQRCDAIAAYRLTFYRQERLGVFQTLGKVEKIAVIFRADPFSVKFTWDDPASYLAESVYVAGENDNKLIVREKHGLLGLPPVVRRLDAIDSVRWGQSKRPITDFGLSKLMERTISTIDRPPAGQPARIEYRGVTTLELTGQEAHHLVVMRAVAPGHPDPRQDMWIDTQTQLPAGTALYLPEDKLDALYLYADVRPDASISDKDFQPGAGGPTSKPAKGPRS